MSYCFIKIPHQERVVATRADEKTLLSVIDGLVPDTEYTIKVLPINPGSKEYLETIDAWEKELDHGLSLSYSMNRVAWRTSKKDAEYVRFIVVIPKPSAPKSKSKK
jgi:hypothetical protein